MNFMKNIINILNPTRGVIEKGIDKAVPSKDNRDNIKNERVLFERGYYKDISSEKIVEILDKWSKVMFDTKNSFISKGTEQEIAQEMSKAHSEILLYCSNETIEVLALVQQLAYLSQSETINQYENMFLYSLIVSCIRHDYSGLFLNPLTLMKIKLNDFKNYEENFIPFVKKYKEYYRKNIM